MLLDLLKGKRLEMRTYMAKPADVKQRWFLVDAEGKVVGRLATRIATILMGKHKPTYTPHIDTGDFVVVVNAGKVRLTGKKLDQKLYYRHSGYLGSMKTTSAAQMLENKPTEVLKLAVARMLPKTKLGRSMLSKLKLYADADHPHEAQQPEPLEISTAKGV